MAINDECPGPRGIFDSSHNRQANLSNLPRQSAEACAALVIEDHPLYRHALVNVLQMVLGGPGIAAATSVEEGLRLASASPALRLVLLDIGLPGMGGTEAVLALRRICPDVAVLIVSASEDRRDVEATLRAGARAFVSKTVGADTIANIVRAVMADKLTHSVWLTPLGEEDYFKEALPEMTSRQRQILAMLSSGLSNKEVALRLDLAEVTVKMHVSSIFRMLGVTSRTQAVLSARRLGLCE